MNTQDRVEMTGIVSDIEKEYQFHDKKYGRKESFYRILLKVPRFSENYDEVPVIVPHKLLAHEDISVGSYVRMTGSVRTRNYKDENNEHHMAVFSYADSFAVIAKEEYDETELYNRVYLSATVCRQTRLRRTNSGRIITDVLVAYNRYYANRRKRNSHESYYIPCIAWGPNAKAAEKLVPGDKIELVGRFQSRKYRRKSDILDNTHVAYEVSILDYNLVDENTVAAGAAISQ